MEALSWPYGTSGPAFPEVLAAKTSPLVALDYLRRGDTLVVWKLDRLGRSVKEVLTIADDLRARGVGVRILTGKLASSYSPAGEGKFFFTMMAAFAELERDIIHERTLAGPAAAKAQGRTSGRPTVMDADKLAAARARRARGRHHRAAPPANLRGQGWREAHGVRGGSRRRQRQPQVRHVHGRQGLAVSRPAESRAPDREPGKPDPWAAEGAGGYSDEPPF